MQGFKVAMDSGRTIEAGSTVIVKLPSGTYKKIHVSKNASTCSLGKFGSFNPQELVGHIYGYTYEIQSDKSLKILSNLVAQEIEDESGTNEFIKDEGENQTLKQEDIAAMKAAGSRGDLIAELKKNNRSYALKTEFSKNKYDARKMAKFAPRFTTVPGEAFDMVNYLLEKDSGRTLELNNETLGYILNTADVREGAEYLIVDEMAGMMVCAVLERGGNVTMVHDTEHANLDCMKHFSRLDQDELQRTGRLHTVNWEQVSDPEGCLAEIDAFLSRPDDAHPRMLEKKERRRQYKGIITRFHGTSFAGCIAASTYNPTSFLPFLLPRVQPSRRVVVYSAYREPLLALRHTDFKQLLAPSITEVRAREFQVLPSRTRPMMMKRGEWGFVYSAFRVERTVNAHARVLGRAKRANPSRNAEAEGARNEERDGTTKKRREPVESDRSIREESPEKRTKTEAVASGTIVSIDSSEEAMQVDR